jgi:hypothetical protein
MKKMVALVFAVAGMLAAPAAWENPPPGFKLKMEPAPMAKRLKQINPAAQGEFRLVPTYVSCSMCWGVAAPVEGLSLEFRKTGSGKWRKGETPMFFDDAANYRASILYLDEDTAYEARLVAKGKVLAKGTFRTWKSDVPVAKTIVIDPAKATYPIVISEKGRPDGWIRYTAPKGTVVGGPGITQTSVISVKGAEYVLLDDMTIEGGGGDAESCVFIGESRGVRVRNCDIYGFGLVGSQVFSAKGYGRFFLNSPISDPEPGRCIDWHAGVMIYPGSSEITVERCYIHDPRGRSIAWYYSHPAGKQGIFVFRAAGSVVLRWNDIVASDLHRWNDAIEGCDNFAARGGFNRDSDIYGNFCIYANDDCIELDGGQQNVRCFQNRFEAGYSDVSIQGCMVSPVYLFDNLLAPCCDEFGVANPTIKTYGFDMFWYAPYAMVKGNCIGEASYRPVLGPTSRWDWRDGNIFVTNDVPASWACGQPVRKLPFMLDRGIIKDVKVVGLSATPQTVRFSAKADERVRYRVRKNFDADWFSVSPSEGTLKKGENHFTVTFFPERMKGRRQWRSAFLLRTDEGLSRCMSVYAERTDFEQPAQPIPAAARTIYVPLKDPIRFPSSKIGKEGVEVAFDVSEEAEYWLFLRGKADWGASVAEVSVDGSEFKSVYFKLWKTHAAWNMIRPGTSSYNSAGGFVPFRFKPGRHTLRLRPLRGRPLTVLDVAVSDQPLAFEPR